MRALRRLALKYLRPFAVAREAMVAIEFALVLPFMLLLYVGIAEISSAFQIKQRMALAEMTLGDLVGRSASLSASQIDDVFFAADMVMVPYSTAPLSITIRAIEIDSSGGNRVLWARQNDSNTPNMTPTAELPAGLGTNRDLIEITTTYRYNLNLLFSAAIDLQLGQTAYFVPRTADLSSWNGID